MHLFMGTTCIPTLILDDFDLVLVFNFLFNIDTIKKVTSENLPLVRTQPSVPQLIALASVPLTGCCGHPWPVAPHALALNGR